MQYNRYDPTSTGGTDNTAIFEFGHGLSYTEFGYGAVLEDYEVKHTTLRHPLGLVRQRGQQVLRSALTDLVGEFLCKIVM